MVSRKLLAALAALSFAVSSEAGVCRPKTTTALSAITTSTAATTAATTTATTSVSTETVSVTNSETSATSSETSTSAGTTESSTETASTTAEGTTSTTVGTSSTADGTTSTTEGPTSTAESTWSTAEDTTSTAESTSSTAEDTTSTTDGITSTTVGTTSTSEAPSTTTSEAPPPTVTAKLTFNQGGGPVTRQIKVNSKYLVHDLVSPDSFIVIREGGTVRLASDPSKKVVIYNSSSSVGVFYVMTDEEAATTGHLEVTCRLGENDTVRCQESSRGLTEILQCGAYIYLAAPSFNQASCNRINGNLRAAQ
ncbi:hypothetical protein ACHAPT_009286 [Fusarium lateritium]